MGIQPIGSMLYQAWRTVRVKWYDFLIATCDQRSPYMAGYILKRNKIAQGKLF